MRTKKCTKCELELTFDNFYKQKNGKYGLKSICKICNEKIRDVYRLNNLDLCAKQARNYRLNNKDVYNKNDREYRALYHKSIKGYASRLYGGAKYRSKKKNMDIEITSEWIYNRLEPLICEVTGFALTIKSGGSNKTQPLQPTLDRIDNSKGYTINNTRVTCWWYNVMKQDWSDEEIINLVKNFYKNKLKDE